MFSSIPFPKAHYLREGTVGKSCVPTERDGVAADVWSCRRVLRLHLVAYGVRSPGTLQPCMIQNSGELTDLGAHDVGPGRCSPRPCENGT